MLSGLTLNNTYAHALAIATAAVGQIVAYVPAWRPEAQPIISGGSIILATAMLIFEGITRKGTVVAGTGEVAKTAEAAGQKAARAELSRIFGAAAQTQAAAAPQAAPAPVSAPPAPQAPTQAQ